MKKHFRLTLLLVWALLAPAAPAAGLNLDQSYDAALKRSETIADQAEQIYQAEQQYKQAFGYLLPNFNATASYFRQQQLEVGGSAANFFPKSQPLVKISGNQPLFRGLRDFAALKVADWQKEEKIQARAQAELQLFKDLASAFYQVLTLEKDLQNLAQESALFEKRIADLQARARIGRSRHSEALTVQAALASLRAEAEQVRGQLAATRELFAFQTGLAADTAVEDHAAPLVSLPPLESYLARRDKRPDVQLKLALQQEAAKNVNIAWGQHLPSADLYGNYYPYRSGNFADVKWDFTAALTFPIFSGGITSAQVRQAHSQERQSRLAVSLARRQAEEEIRSLHDQSRAALEQEKALAKAKALSQEDYRLQLNDYRLGLVDNQTVLQAMTQLTNSERAHDRARFAARLNPLLLEAAAAMQPRTLAGK